MPKNYKMPSNKNQSIKGTIQKRVPKLNFPNPPKPPSI